MKKCFSLIIVAALAGIMALWYIASPKKSADSLCEMLENGISENNLTGQYSLSFSKYRTNNAGEMARYIGELKRHAPGSLDADLAKLEDIFKRTSNNPHGFVAESVQGYEPEQHIKTWRSQNCIENNWSR